MDSVFSLFGSLQKGDYSVLDITPAELESCFRELLNNALKEIRNLSKPYQSEYWISKEAISCAFKNETIEGGSHFGVVFNRLMIIDNAYATQMRMRPYGVGELAEAICSLGTDAVLRHKFQNLLKNSDLTPFDYLKSQQILYKDGDLSPASNIFSEGFGVESNKPSDKRALSLITKYAYFLTDKQFPIYDSLVRALYPVFWKCCGSNTQKPKINDSIVDYIKAIDELRTKLGGLSYDELDYILWTVGKILNNSLSSVLSMDDYVSLYSTQPSFDFNRTTITSMPFLMGNNLLKAIFELAYFISNVK